MNIRSSGVEGREAEREMKGGVHLTHTTFDIRDVIFGDLLAHADVLRAPPVHIQRAPLALHALVVIAVVVVIVVIVVGVVGITVVVADLLVLLED